MIENKEYKKRTADIEKKENSRIPRMVYTVICTCLGWCFCVVPGESKEFLLDHGCLFSVYTKSFLFYYMGKGDIAESFKWRTGFPNV